MLLFKRFRREVVRRGDIWLVSDLFVDPGVYVVDAINSFDAPPGPYGITGQVYRKGDEKPTLRYIDAENFNKLIDNHNAKLVSRNTQSLAALAAAHELAAQWAARERNNIEYAVNMAESKLVSINA